MTRHEPESCALFFVPFIINLQHIGPNHEFRQPLSSSITEKWVNSYSLNDLLVMFLFVYIFYSENLQDSATDHGLGQTSGFSTAEL
jgi:hypothetical protein